MHLSWYPLTNPALHMMFTSMIPLIHCIFQPNQIPGLDRANVSASYSRITSTKSLSWCMLSSNSFWTKLISPRQHLLINAAPCKLVSLGLYTVSPVTMPPCKAFCNVHCWTFGKCVLQFCLNHGDIIKSPSFESHIEIWDKKVATWC